MKKVCGDLGRFQGMWSSGQLRNVACPLTSLSFLKGSGLCLYRLELPKSLIHTYAHHICKCLTEETIPKIVHVQIPDIRILLSAPMYMLPNVAKGTLQM